MEQKKKEAISLLRLLAEGSTQKVRSLLSRYGAKSSGSYNELAASLADLYKRVPDKVTLEKEIVAMHPHKDLILRYNNKPEKKEAVEAIENLQVMTNPETKEVKMAETKEVKSNCSGCKSGCDSSKMSSAEGDSTSDIVGQILKAQQAQSRQHMIINGVIIGTITVGLLAYFKILNLKKIIA